MGLFEDIIKETADICGGAFTVNDGRVIPSVADIPLTNEGRRINIVALFVDIRKSTAIVKAIGNVRAARLYKAYLQGVARIARNRGGSILSFNGDGVAIGFTGVNGSSAAVLSALNINWFLSKILKSRVDNTLKAVDPETELQFDFGLGIDAGEVLVVRGGVRGADNNDLVWAGNPLNVAVKVSSKASLPHAIYISNAVYQNLNGSLTTTNGTAIWEKQLSIAPMMIVWRTDYWFGVDYIKNVPPDETPAMRALAAALLPKRRPLLPPAPWEK